MDDHVLVLPEDATPPMGFGTDRYSYEKCAAALSEPHTNGLDLYQAYSYPPDQGEMENSDNEYANFDVD